MDEVANQYGKDLQIVPPEWLDPNRARALIQQHGLELPAPGGATRPRDSNERVDFWEIFAGCCHATEAVLHPDIGCVAGPPVDVERDESAWPTLPKWDVLSAKVRELLWALLIVLAPSWIHCAPPCTFWSSLSRRSNRRAEWQEEHLRLKSLVFLRLSVQFCLHQARQRRFFSFEQPPQAASWRLDLVQELLAPASGGTGRHTDGGGGATKFVFDSCAWGLADPGNGRLFRKRQCFASNGDMSSLCRKRQCPTRHQIVEGQVSGGPRHGVRRAKIAGEHPVDFCLAWAKVIKHCVVDMPASGGVGTFCQPLAARWCQPLAATRSRG